MPEEKLLSAEQFGNNGPQAIWLGPKCEEKENEGRTWCNHDNWEGGCDECGEKPVKYVRADIYVALEAKHARELAAIRAEVEKLPHEDGCAIYDYAGTRCVICGVGIEHVGDGPCRLGFTHDWFTVENKPCDCARGRALKLAGGTE